MAKIEFPKVLNVYETQEKAIIKLDTIRFSYGMPAVIRYKDKYSGSTRCIFAIGIDDGIGKYRVVNDNEHVSYYSAVRYREETDEETIQRTFYGKEVKAGDIFQLVTLKGGKTIDTTTYIYSGKSWESLVNMISASKIILNIPALGEGLSLDDVLSDMLNKIASGGISWSSDSDLIFSEVIDGDENSIVKIKAALNLYNPLPGELPNAIIRKNNNQLYVADYSGDIYNVTRKVVDIENTIKNIQKQWNVDNNSIIYDEFSGTYRVGKVDGGNIN